MIMLIMKKSPHKFVGWRLPDELKTALIVEAGRRTAEERRVVSIHQVINDVMKKAFEAPPEHIMLAPYGCKEYHFRLDSDIAEGVRKIASERGESSAAVAFSILRDALTPDW